MEWFITNWKEVTLSLGLLGIVGALLRKIWVPGWLYQEKIDEIARLREEVRMWQRLALEANNVASKTVDIAEKIVSN